MFVVPDARRRGIGRQLMLAVEEEARRRGLGTLRLDTRRDLVEARALYASEGYAEIPAFTRGEYVDHWFEKHLGLSLIHISEPTRLGMISYAVFCLKKKKKQ